MGGGDTEDTDTWMQGHIDTWVQGHIEQYMES